MKHWNSISEFFIIEIMIWSCFGQILVWGFFQACFFFFLPWWSFHPLTWNSQGVSSKLKLLGELENFLWLICSLSLRIDTFLALRPNTHSYRSTIHVICYWICCWMYCQGCLWSKPEQTLRACRLRVHLAVIHISSRTLPWWAASV